jgi:hypothetical protein
MKLAVKVNAANKVGRQEVLKKGAIKKDFSPLTLG